MEGSYVKTWADVSIPRHARCADQSAIAHGAGPRCLDTPPASATDFGPDGALSRPSNRRCRSTTSLSRTSRWRCGHSQSSSRLRSQWIRPVIMLSRGRSTHWSGVRSDVFSDEVRAVARAIQHHAAVKLGDRSARRRLAEPRKYCMNASRHTGPKKRRGEEASVTGVLQVGFTDRLWVIRKQALDGHSRQPLK